MTCYCFFMLLFIWNFCLFSQTQIVHYRIPTVQSMWRQLGIRGGRNKDFSVPNMLEIIQWVCHCAIDFWQPAANWILCGIAEFFRFLVTIATRRIRKMFVQIFWNRDLRFLIKYQLNIQLESCMTWLTPGSVGHTTLWYALWSFWWTNMFLFCVCSIFWSSFMVSSCEVSPFLHFDMTLNTKLIIAVECWYWILLIFL